MRSDHSSESLIFDPHTIRFLYKYLRATINYVNFFHFPDLLHFSQKKSRKEEELK